MLIDYNNLNFLYFLLGIIINNLPVSIKEFLQLIKLFHHYHFIVKRIIFKTNFNKINFNYNKKIKIKLNFNSLKNQLLIFNILIILFKFFFF